MMAAPVSAVYANAPVPPAKTIRRPSVANVMSFLHKSSTSISSLHSQRSRAPYTATKPVRISEPQSTGSLDALARGRAGLLGSGATVVRTPYEALISSEDCEVSSEGKQDFLDSTYSEDGCELPSPPESPPLPPLPLSDTASMESSSSKLTFGLSRPAGPARPCPPIPTALAMPLTPETSPVSRPSLTMRASSSCSPPVSEIYPPLPPVPQHLQSSPPQADFEPVLMSTACLPDLTNVNPSQIIVSVETSTATYKTSLSTLTSRSSHLASYLSTLVESTSQDCSEEAESDATSMYSQHSEIQQSDAEPTFDSIFRNHLTEAGVMPLRAKKCTHCIEIFLDRPSAPYNHILSYLRSQPTCSQPLLPRAAQLPTSSPSSFFTSRLDALLELRDEALFLGLEELHRLCVDEISIGVRSRSKYGHGHAQQASGSNSSILGLGIGLGMSGMRPALHIRGESVRSAHSISTSVHSVHTLVEEDEGREDEQANLNEDQREGPLLDRAVPSSMDDDMQKNIPEAGPQEFGALRQSEQLPSATLSGLQRRLQLRERSKSREKGDSLRNRPTGEWI